MLRQQTNFFQKNIEIFLLKSVLFKNQVKFAIDSDDTK